MTGEARPCEAAAASPVLQGSAAEDLTSEPVRVLLRRLAVPASVGLFFSTMYNAVDTAFAGLIATRALAALSLSLPVFFIIIAVGSGFGTGATALIGNALGRGDRERAGVLAVKAIGVGVGLSAVLTGVGLWASPFLFAALGASGDYLAVSLVYMRVIFLGAIFFVTVYILNGILNALGDTRSFRDFLIVGFFLNVGLDPWFIYGGLGVPAMGIAGIALATVLIQVIGCAYLGWRIARTGFLSCRRPEEALPDRETLGEIATQGLPATVNLLTVGTGIFVITYFVSVFGEKAVAAYGSAMRVEQIVLIPTIGLNTATLALVAQNNGARLYGRVRETLRAALVAGAWVMALGTAGVIILARPLMGVFTDDAAVIEAGTLYLRIDALALYAYVVLFVHMAALQGIKRPMFAIWIGLARQIVLPGAVFAVLVHGIGTGLAGIWWGIFGITWAAALFTALYARRILDRTFEKTEPPA